MIGKVIEGRYIGSGVYKLPDKNALFVQTEDGTHVEISKSNAISVDDVTVQYPSSGNKVMMVMWNDFETSIIQYGVCGLETNQEIPNIVNNTLQIENVFQTEGKTDKSVELKRKGVNKKACFSLAVIIAVVITAFLAFQLSEFARVKNEVIEICGVYNAGRGHFTIDTYPDYLKNSAVVMLPGQEERALQGIQYANEALGFSGALYSKMMETNALMGMQSEENGKYRVSWSYHPDDGLEVIYEKK